MYVCMCLHTCDAWEIMYCSINTCIGLSYKAQYHTVDGGSLYIEMIYLPRFSESI